MFLFFDDSKDVDYKDVNAFALRSNFEKETVPDSSIRQRYATKRVHAHRKKKKKKKKKNVASL